MLLSAKTKPRRRLAGFAASAAPAKITETAKAANDVRISAPAPRHWLRFPRSLRNKTDLITKKEHALTGVLFCIQIFSVSQPAGQRTVHAFFSEELYDLAFSIAAMVPSLPRRENRTCRGTVLLIDSPPKKLVRRAFTTIQNLSWEYPCGPLRLL
jgi:hypothetical protein